MNPDTYVPRDFAPNDRRNVLKAMNALEAIVDAWATDTNVRGWAERLSAMPEETRVDAIEGVITTFMMEAAYRARMGDTGGVEKP